MPPFLAVSRSGFSNAVTPSPGKSTQVPQFLLEASAGGAPVSVIVTQPRRIAAISVATRVAAERGERVGSSVGYRIRGESAVSTATRVTFVTTGVLLRQLSNYREADEEAAADAGGDRNGEAPRALADLLEGTTHVVIDEVHERAVDTDLILLLLRDALVASTTRAKVILMSATVDAVKLGAYFSGSIGVVGGGRRAHTKGASAAPRSTVPVVDIPGRTFPVTQLYLEDAVRLTGYRLRPGSRYARSRAAVAREERLSRAAAMAAAGGKGPPGGPRSGNGSGGVGSGAPSDASSTAFAFRSAVPSAVALAPRKVRAPRDGDDLDDGNDSWEQYADDSDDETPAVIERLIAAHDAAATGVTVRLADRNPVNFRFSILERVSPDAPAEEVIALEQTWMERLGTVEFGLNRSAEMVGADGEQVDGP